MRRRPFPLVTLLIVFAIFGFSYRLWNDPMQLLKQVFLIGLVAAVFYGIYKWIQRQSFSRSYQKAVKQSKNSTIKNEADVEKTTAPNRFKEKARHSLNSH